MCGCLSGTLPQLPQQNVFLGLPLELMTEEVALLLEKGASYVVDDVQAHTHGLNMMMDHGKRLYLRAREEACLIEAIAYQKSSEEKKSNYVGERMPNRAVPHTAAHGREQVRVEGEGEGERESVFGPVPSAPSTSAAPTEPVLAIPAKSEPVPFTSTAKSHSALSVLFYPTAAISSSIYHRMTPLRALQRPEASSYLLFKHLHSAGYYLSPGLRFGCQFMAYPGDPLRFHSHFLTYGLSWDQDFDFLQIIGGGRLGTGVKKAWMFGGCADGKEANIRLFCVEWAGF